MTTNSHRAVKNLRKMHGARWCLLLLTLGCSMAGCQQAAKTEPATDPTGVYALVSVNGNTVPTRVKHERAELLVRSGTFTINSDGTCQTKTVFVPPGGSEVTREVSADYTQKGSKLTMQWHGAGMTTGTVQENTFTMNNEGMVFVYRK